MSDYDVFGSYEPEQPATLEEVEPKEELPPGAKREQKPGRFWNFVTFIFVLATIAFVVWVVMIYQNPDSPLNPLPPPTPVPTATLYRAPTQDLPPSWTPSPTVTEGPSPTVPSSPTATNTPFPSPTRTTDVPGATPVFPVDIYIFSVQGAAATYTKHPDGCEGSWIVGQIFGLQGESLKGISVYVRGDNFEHISFSGEAPRWGVSGFEVYLNSTPVEDRFEVRLISGAGQPWSDWAPVKTLSSCERNVAILNFVQTRSFDE